MRKAMFGPLPASRNTPPPVFIYEPPQEPRLNVLYQDDDLLVLSKPSGLLSVPGKHREHADSLETRVLAEFPEATTVHRLDRGTSGVLMMARNPKAHRHLGLQFERRKTSKTYIARVAGKVEPDSGTIDLPLLTDWQNRPKQMVDRMLGREATTNWRVVERERNATRMELTPITGRSHQLRVHMQELGHPILGDSFYAPLEIVAAADRLQLHAEKLSIFHPADGREITFCDPCPF